MENTTPHITTIQAKRPASDLPKNLIAFSHLRWDFVFQRPQQLLSRLSKKFNVYFWEEPQHDADERAYLTLSTLSKNLSVVVPHLPAGLLPFEQRLYLKDLLDRLLAAQNLQEFVCWYYTPMALEFSEHLQPKLLVYDCMDELAAFKFAPENISQMERKLFKKADLVFTGGHSLFEAKKRLHGNIFPFPSSIDKLHFAKARAASHKVLKLKSGIRLGFFGVIDERFDAELIRQIAEKRPDWEIILAGPVVKIDPETLPRLDNIHYTGAKLYEELPRLIAEWDIALIPFQINASTRYISPTKTPEYMAAGKPVISTPIRDVVQPYGVQKLVTIAEDAEEFINAAEKIQQWSLNTYRAWLEQVDRFLLQHSWNHTCEQMLGKITETLEEKTVVSVA